MSTTASNTKTYPRKSRRRNGAAPRQLNPLKPQYAKLLTSWRDDGDWVKSQFINLKLPFVVDVGCGEGEWAIETAQKHSYLNVLGLELRSEALTKDCRAHANNSKNLALVDANVLAGDLHILFKDIVQAGGTISGVLVQCPDPHWKSKHRKRRILGLKFINTCQEFAEGGFLLVRTDVQPVINDICYLLRNCGMHPEDESSDALAMQLCQIPTERMVYVRRKGGVMYSKIFRIRRDQQTANLASDALLNVDDREPLFGFYD